MEVNFRDKSQLNSVMNIMLHTLLMYILEHNIGSVSEMTKDIQDSYNFLKDNRTNELQHIDIVDRRMKKINKKKVLG
ncbi:hypothetical protein [Myroides odoratus]|uniref:Uncharacterized protein n=1 Tax=Myroides odoratus TaxID=256 RepID=A0A9Q6Z342_MYROD|nr:hypothetical protein [Myroides odoratus]EHQ41486.1 hypothetical protein Myrod_0650 [Myroides odoratus DSM 2801]EKB02721.1 hypothetical protein HMPREF9716_03654 [Myroides odoratus CIP 103059]QQT98913.1 hypothetical protein I6I88_11880 [Myroides odoratus]WQD58902.1 hypothetical protein U0010_07095 [Myroides odoratus]STZ28749.1 Uncharacterised protein [Myroides odoratus]